MSAPNSEMLTQLTAAFLRAQYPFELLNALELQTLARASALDFFPRGTILLAQDGKASDALYVIQKGSVTMAVETAEGATILLDQRGEGESFGLTSMLRGETKMNVTTAEDTLCYVIPRNVLEAVLRANVHFGEALVRASAQRYLERTLQALREQSGKHGGHQLFALPISSLVKRALVACAPVTTIQEAATLMRAQRVSSIIITDAAQRAVGIVTDRDLRGRVVADGLNIRAPISEIMSAPVIAMDQDALAFEALLRMLNRGIHHLVVTQSGDARGVITSTDLMLAQSALPLLIAERINQQTSVTGLAATLSDTTELAARLFQEGVPPTRIARVLAEINDRVTLKLLTLAEKELGAPPAPYCWLALGSEGRQEQTFKTDQDNGLVYADSENGDRAHISKEYFARFAEWMGDALEACGYPRCKGNYMARNPKWCQPLSVWKNYYRAWIETPEPQAVLDSTILFDLRGIGTATVLGEMLREFICEHARGKNVFRAHMARAALGRTPPLGLFRQFLLERGGEHAHTFDLKERGTGLLVDLARVLALEHGITETNTVERLQQLAQMGAFTDEQMDELIHTYEFLMLLRVRHQLAEVEEQRAPDNALDPATLNAVERATLKECFHVIAQYQEVLSSEMMVDRLG